MTIGAPEQSEFDSLALFVEAANELKQSPFLIQEHENLSLHFKARELVAADFPDPQVRDALLVHFRRLWLDSEPCNFTQAIKTMKRYVPHWRVLLDQFHDRFNSEKANWYLLPPLISPVYSPKDTIDIWLNCRLLHGGMRGRTGRFTRKDFDRATEAMGEVQFEYCFLVAVLSISCVFCSALRSAEDLLAHWKQAGHRPSSEPQAPATRGMQQSAQGVRVTRISPGWSRAQETAGQALSRLCRRREFAAVEALLEWLPGELEHAAQELQRVESFEGFLTRLGIAYDEEDEPSEQDKAVGFFTVFESRSPALGAPTVRRGLVTVLDRAKFVFAGEALPVLRDQYGRLRPHLHDALKHRGH